MFLAGGNAKGGIKRGSKGEGLPESVTARRGACLDKSGARKDKERRSGGVSKVSKEGTKSIFRPLYMVERSTYYIANRNRVLGQGNRMLPKGAQLSGCRGGDTFAIDEMETITHEFRRRERTGAYKEKKTKGVRRRKDLVMKRCC
jgi:hypothetical protein